MKALESASSFPANADRQSSRISRANQIAEALVLAALFAAPALTCLHAMGVADPDIWWHMSTAQWILSHHAIPHTDAFTNFGYGKPWQAYSWLFELIVFKSYQWLGLSGILAYTVAMVLAITAALYRLIRRLQPDFTVGVMLTVIASLSLMRLFTPRPWLFTIFFFTLQLDILMNARRTGKLRELLWLPAIYAVWANVHIQFVEGLLALFLAFAEAILSRWWASARSRLNPARLGGIVAACVLATLLNPYGWHIYQIAFGLASQSGAQSLINELHALEFRQLSDYCMLFLALAAACALASPAPRKDREWRRPYPLLEVALLVLAAILSFRSARDIWVMVISASAILAQGMSGNEKDRQPLPVFSAAITAAATALILFGGIRVMRVNNAALSARVAEHMPARAAEVIREKNFQGPLYNTFDWGGYLFWDLHMPVSIDGRAAFNGDKRLMRSFATWNGLPDWASDPDLRSAGLVIGPVSEPLTQLLRTDPRFQLAYEDKSAAVFIARRLHERPAIPGP